MPVTRPSLLCAILGLATAIVVAPSARAGVFKIGGTYSVTGTDFPTDFGPQNVTLDGTTKLINAGQLALSETITPVSPTSAFILFNFSTVSGGPIASDASAEWSLSIDNVPINGSGVLSNPFVYFTANGTPFAPLTPASGFDVTTNPITGSGPVLDFVGFEPVTVTGSFDPYVFSNPYMFLSAVGVNPSETNDVHFGAEISLLVPGSVLLLGAGLLGLGAVLRRGRARS